MRTWYRWASILYLIVGVSFIYLAVRGPRTDSLRLALGVIFLALAVWRFRRFRRMPPSGAASRAPDDRTPP